MQFIYGTCIETAPALYCANVHINYGICPRMEYCVDGRNEYAIHERRYSTYLSRCVDAAENVPPHSLHYALRFSESAKYLSDKLGLGLSHSFVDLGAGLSPLAAAIQTEYNINDAYIIDNPAIMAAYVRTAELVGGRIPKPITWDDAKEMSMEHNLDTIVAMGVLHYMPVEEQIERMRFINSHIPNFMLEIKYNNGEIAPNENSFNLS